MKIIGLMEDYMRLKRYKKKNKTMNKKQASKKQDILVDTDDKEQRRATRLGAIIAIVAIIGTMGSLFIKMTYNLINVWPNQGIIFKYFQLLFLLTLSTLVIMFVDIVLYVLSDLKRYNILNKNYRQFDQESDNRYMYLQQDFSFNIIMLVFVFSIYLPLSSIYEEGVVKCMMLLFSHLFIFYGIFFAIKWIKDRTKKEKIKLVVKSLKWMFMTFICYGITLIFIVNNESTIGVSYNPDGLVEIWNTSSKDYDRLDIEISNRNDEIIYTKSVEEGNLLLAMEEKYINIKTGSEDVEEGVLLNNEWIHWKYSLDLTELINQSGEYYISIEVYQDGKRVSLINTLSVENEEYIFAKDSLEKEY